MLFKRKDMGVNFDADCRLMNINNSFGYYDIDIFSLEYSKYNSKIELLNKERCYIELLKPICNEVIPIRFNEEKNGI